MNVKKYLIEKIAKGTLHFTLLDPDKQPVEEAADIAAKAEAAGTDAIMIGGSTDVTQDNLDETAKAIKKACKLPTIYFPSGAHAISGNCDAIFFMSMVNSASVDWIIGEQVKGSLITKKLGLEPISMGYIIVEPGMKVGEVGRAVPIKRDDLKGAMSYALACEYLGMSFVYLEAGSGADRPVPPEMIKAVKDVLSVPLIVGGGIRTPEAAKAARLAGADAIVTGTFVERCSDDSELKNVIKAAKG
ncbi:MAG: geranylgeranylglyceryl/heptaprenylglyceryl phosphate synthase [Methanomassiliicoccaceae archaeon]|jgi:phosphoglycerol geranylgeranyltransferase|nr:geranylgeranylglyceryl/heptaprenylglyceryl phosphate synthase [Methanomassiliicoccaceae archaeon]